MIRIQSDHSQNTKAHNQPSHSLQSCSHLEVPQNKGRENGDHPVGSNIHARDHIGQDDDNILIDAFALLSPRCRNGLAPDQDCGDGNSSRDCRDADKNPHDDLVQAPCRDAHELGANRCLDEDGARDVEDLPKHHHLSWASVRVSSFFLGELFLIPGNSVTYFCALHRDQRAILRQH